ncbi:MAG: domain 2 [Verrucomicrobiota bacterium]|jgi:hypothetical protein
MNYYLARDGQTYGPYPQETFPGMLEQGQVIPQDLVCPEGGSEWVELSKVPALAGAPSAPALKIGGAMLAAPVVAASSATAGSGPAMPTPVASSKLRISGTSGVSSQSRPTSPVITATPAQSPPVTHYSQQKTGLLEKAAGAWGLLRIIGYAALVIFVVVSVIAGYFVSQRDKKEIAKLATQPGWKAFDAGNSRINDETSTEGYGNNGEAQRLARQLATATETVQRMSFELEKTPRYRGRSKLGRIVSAVDSATAGKGHFQTYVELRDDRAIVLIHVPEFSRYKTEARQSMTELCWESANFVLNEAMKASEPKPLPVRAPAMAPPVSRIPGRAYPARPAVLPVPAPPPKVEPKPVKDRTLIVGVRGKSNYECVFVGTVTDVEDAPPPAPIKKNVPSHKALVKWFGDEKPTPDQTAAR